MACAEDRSNRPLRTSETCNEATTSNDEISSVLLLSCASLRQIITRAEEHEWRGKPSNNLHVAGAVATPQMRHPNEVVTAGTVVFSFLLGRARYGLRNMAARNT